MYAVWLGSVIFFSQMFTVGLGPAFPDFKKFSDNNLTIDLRISNSHNLSDPDPFGPVSFWSVGSGSASKKPIRIWVAKNQSKSWNMPTKINLNH